MKYGLTIVAVVVAVLVACGSGNARADREACVSQIEATNNAAGMATDYTGAYRTCRAR